MNKVLNFQEYKLQKEAENQTNSTDSRGVFYLLVVMNLVRIFQNLFLNEKLSRMTVHQSVRSFSTVPLIPDNFFVRLPQMISHGFTVRGYMQAELIEQVIDEFNQGIITNEFRRIAHVYCYAFTEERNEKQLILSFKGTNNSQDMTLIVSLEMAAADRVMFDVTFNLWVPVSDNAYANLDHVYAIDMISYSILVMQKYLPNIDIM